MSAAAALAETAAHIAACRDELMTWPGRASVSLDGCVALDALATSIKALTDARLPIEDGSDALEGIVDQLHDLASDVSAWHRKRMEQPAHDATADWQKHEGIAA